MKPYKLYWSETKCAWVGRWKDAKEQRWRNKCVPCELTHEQDAKEWFAQWWATNRLDEAAPQPVIKLTVSQLFEWWIGYLKTKPGADPRASSDADRTHRIWVQPFSFAHVRVDELGLEHCVDWIEDVQRRGKAPLTVRNVVQQVRTMFSDARGKGRYRGENFFNDQYVKSRLKGAEPKAGKDVIVHLNLDEVRRVVGYEGDAVPLRRHARNVLAMLTGLRASEIQALRWSDVDLDGRPPVVRVHRQYVSRLSSLTKPAFKPPKRNSKRTVPLHPEVVRVLKRWRDEWSAFTGRDRIDDDPIFAGSHGGYVSDFRSTELRLDLGAYGVSPLFEKQHPIIPHALRKTCLTLLTNARVPEGDVKAIAGHAKAGVTRKHYVAEDLGRLADAINTMLPEERKEAAE